MQKNILYLLVLGCSIASIILYNYTDRTDSCNETESYDSLWDAVIYGSYDDVQTLIAQGVSVTEYETESALHAAAQRGDLALAQLLIKHGADVHSKSYESGWTPLHQAAREGNVAMAKLFVQHGADVNEKSKPISENVYDVQETALHVAANAGHLAMVQFLVEHGADVNAPSGVKETYTPLHYAIEHGYTEIVTFLLEHGAHCKDIPGAEPLLITACSQENTEILKLLLAHGCDINEQDKDGLTPLMMAIQNNYTEQVAYLLHQHADTSIQDYHGNTALYYAAQQENKEIEQLLVASGASTQQTTNII